MQTVYGTLVLAFNEMVYIEHSAMTSGSLCIKIIEGNGNKFGYNKHTLGQYFLHVFLCWVGPSVHINCYFPCLLNHHRGFGHICEWQKHVIWDQQLHYYTRELKSVLSSSPTYLAIYFLIIFCELSIQQNCQHLLSMITSKKN